jgi:NADH-quinone oxidoreductase subunit E
MIEAGQPIGVEQPKSFAFTPESLEKAKAAIAKYPAGTFSAIMPLLHIAQEQHGWLPTAAIVACADMLNMPHIRAFEVASFYTMYHRRPVGKHHIQVCTTTPCWLRGSADIVKACEDKLGIGLDEVTKDGKFSLCDVECLGACVNAPMVQINDDYYEDLTPESMARIIDELATGKQPKTGSQIGRQTSCASTGPTTLKEKA